MLADDLQAETTEVLQRLVRFNTVNPPGNERPAAEYLAGFLEQAGLQTELLAAEPERPNLIAELRGSDDGPTLCLLGHLDTVLADPSEWTHDPWSGDVADGFLWGRGALDMKSQVAAEAVAAAALARSGWRPERGHLKLVFVVDEETGGEVGAQWLTSTHPDRVRCEMLLNEGGGESFQLGDRRLYGVCCGEKGIFRFTLTARGRAGHASLPRTGDNALLKLGPVLDRLAAAGPSFEMTDAPAALLARLGGDAEDPAQALQRITEIDPVLSVIVEPMLGVTLAPTMAHASDKINVIPSRAQLKVDCRVPPGLGREAALRRIEQVLGDQAAGLDVDFTEEVVGNESPLDTPLMEAIEGWLARADPQAETVPVLLPGFSDSRWFRDAFPDCVAYGFFPQRHQTLLEAAPLVHSADERIDVRDLGFAAGFYADIAREGLGMSQNRKRLDPEIFRLPLERIRRGHYSDAYFVHTKALLEELGRHPRVTMQVFQKKDSLLGGIDEAIAVLKLCCGHDQDGEWIVGWDQLEVRALYEGDSIAPREPVLTIEGDYGLFAHLETVYLGCLARRSLIMRNVAEVVAAAGGKQIFYFPARHDHWLVQTGDGWAAHVAGAIGVSTDAQASWWGGRGVGTVPHGLIAAWGGDTVAAAKAFADRFHDEMNITMLVDFDNDSVRTALEVAEALGPRLWGVRLDTSEDMVDRSLIDEMGGFRPTGVNWRLAEKVRAALDAHGFNEVRIVVSGGFDAARIREFEQAGIPVDAYGVGSSLIRGQNDFTADIVQLEGRPCAKAGRRFTLNPRLEEVE